MIGIPAPSVPSLSLPDDSHFSHRLVEYVVECSDSEGMRLWLLTIQSNMRPHGMSLSDMAERNRLKNLNVTKYTS